MVKNILFCFFCVFIGVLIGFIARSFNAPPLLQSLVVSIGVAIVMLIYFQVKGVFK